MIKGFDLKSLLFKRDPIDFITATLCQPERPSPPPIKEQSDQVHLPSMHGYGKRNISLKIAIRKLHMIRHQSLLTQYFVFSLISIF